MSFDIKLLRKIGFGVRQTVNRAENIKLKFDLVFKFSGWGGGGGNNKQKNQNVFFKTGGIYA